MMLCRVILGNVEAVLSGSKQFQPTNESFDNGVDDLQNPKNYIIWDANVHKHIYAEYAAVVKIPPVTNGTTLWIPPPVQFSFCVVIWPKQFIRYYCRMFGLEG